MESTKSVLADKFKTKYQPKRTRVMLTEVVTKWKEEQLARSIVYQHLRKVAPALALEFAESYRCPTEKVSKRLVNLIYQQQPVSRDHPAPCTHTGCIVPSLKVKSKCLILQFIIGFSAVFTH